MSEQANVDLFNEAAQHAALAIRRLQRSGIPPDLETFIVWYSYYSGEPAPLVAELERAMGSDDSVDAYVSKELFERYVAGGETHATLIGSNDRMRRALGEVVAALSDAAAQAGACGERLLALVPKLDDEPTYEAFRALVADVAGETRRMAAHNASLGTQLSDTLGHLAELRGELEVVRTEAVIDALTGLANRRHFDRTLEETVAAAAEGGSLCLAMLDVDHFKRFNDSFGHAMGDEVLRLVAGVLHQAVGDRGMAARYGGEEFALVIPAATMPEAVALTDSIRASVADRAIVRRSTRERLSTVTLSGGVAAWHPGESPATLVERADRALYAAKGAGRNRVMAAD